MSTNMAASGSWNSPPKLKDFILTDKLGSGTYATVFKGYRKGGVREVVAVKCVKKSSLNNASKENLLTEIELLKTLKHDNIVELKDFLWDEQYIYLIMEYCSGGDLSHFIHGHRTLSEYFAKRFLQQIALALQYMRSMNVSHMDLKPQNILLSSHHQPVLKIGDFGFAHYLIGDTNADSMRGSPLYMAPEILTKRHYNEKADLWSVGVILYECLFGRAPFHSKTYKELEVKITDAKPIELPYGVDISDKCRHLLFGLLKRDPEIRMSFDDFFAHPFIDLEHRPSNKSLEQALSIIKKAIQNDSKGDYPAAVSQYCRALEYFMPAIHYEPDLAKKDALRGKVQEYMQRAEELKHRMKPAPDTAPPTAQQELVDLSNDHKELQAALKVTQSAELKEQREDYEGALKQYELALECLLKILQDEPKGRRRDLLNSQVSQWMDKAESVKQYVTVKDLKTLDTSSQEENDSQFFLTQTCVVQ